MRPKSTGWARAAHRARATVAVVAIVAASVIGLHDWADGAATQERVSGQQTGLDAADT